MQDSETPLFDALESGDAEKYGKEFNRLKDLIPELLSRTQEIIRREGGDFQIAARSELVKVLTSMSIGKSPALTLAAAMPRDLILTLEAHLAFSLAYIELKKEGKILDPGLCARLPERR